MSAILRLNLQVLRRNAHTPQLIVSPQTIIEVITLGAKLLFFILMKLMVLLVLITIKFYWYVGSLPIAST